MGREPFERAVRDEEQLFGSRRQSVQSQIESFDQVGALLRREIETLEQKAASQRRQAELNRQELDGVSQLASKGLVVNSRRLSLEQNAAQLEASQLDLALAIVRARQDISKAERSKVELLNQTRSDVLADLIKTRGRLTEIREKISVTLRLAHETESAALRERARLEQQEAPHSYEIKRAVDGAVRTIEAMEDERVEPGDTVKVLPPTDAGFHMQQIGQTTPSGDVASQTR
jgi:multidrug efflux pump subunit AcrA (membrane-fusion protein)